ncbi:MAG: LacI family DNA-binding transcriptional regulator [Chthonomonadales bacterium]|nr:LacI family DNA-binding transcriptional regulator [Chthonomonadales bacterium]
MTAPRRTTLTDVARLAGVSVGTASNVLNNKGRHTAATRQRVMWAAAEMHFSPNALIRSLQRGRTNTVGVFTWRLHQAEWRDIALAILQGISRTLSQKGMDVLLYARHPHETLVDPSAFLDGRVDGVILAPGGVNADGARALARANLPTVMLYEDPPEPSIASVTIDNRAGITAAVDHLVRLGHRRIGYVSPLYSYDFRQRYDTYRDRLETHGIVPDRRWSATDVVDTDAYYDAVVTRLLCQEAPPTAIIAGNDGIALGLLTDLARRRVRIPGDVSVIGFDDSMKAAEARLTTVRQPAEDLGSCAGRMMLGLLNSDIALERRVELPVTFVARETTGPPSFG